MDNKQSRKKEFIENPKKALWKLSIPMMLGMSVQSLYMLIDTLLISRIVGETSMAALGFAFPFLFIIMGITFGLGSGATAVIAQFIGSEEKRVLFFWHSVGNFILTSLSNMLSNINLTDMENCYKVFKSDIIKNIILKENRFGFEPEVTAKIAKKKVRIYEVGIKYYGRTYEQGKKIGWKDGISAIRCIIKYNLF